MGTDWSNVLQGTRNISRESDVFGFLESAHSFFWIDRISQAGLFLIVVDVAKNVASHSSTKQVRLSFVSTHHKPSQETLLIFGGGLSSA